MTLCFVRIFPISEGQDAHKRESQRRGIGWAYFHFQVKVVVPKALALKVMAL